MPHDIHALSTKTVQCMTDARPSPVESRLKRSADLLITTVILAILWPLLIIIYVLVSLDGGPAFFLHTRVGAQGRYFKCIKFRTMVTNGDQVLEKALAGNSVLAAEWRATRKLRNDPRVTRIGAILRTLSLDELPQLFNVISNDMSLVGPRPITPAEVNMYGAFIRSYYAVRPGITGLWQVSGRSTTTYERRVELDVRYANSWSFAQDMIILLRTVPAVLTRDGAY